VSRRQPSWSTLVDSSVRPSFRRSAIEARGRAGAREARERRAARTDLREHLGDRGVELIDRVGEQR